MTFKTFYNRLDKKFLDKGTFFTGKEGKSLTDQSQACDADINNIMQPDYVCGSHRPFNANRKPLFGDFTQFTHTKLIDSLNYVKNAESQFNQLPSYIRNRFDNDPSKLLEFVNNKDNYDEAVKLGIVNPPKQAQPAKVAVIQNTEVSTPSSGGTSA